MAQRAIWKGFLKVAEVTCPVALYGAVSSSDRIALHTINRASGNRVHRQYVDSETGEPVERDDQVRGYEVASGDFVVLEPEEIASAVPESDKTLSVSTFIRCSDIDTVYFDKPYFLAPGDRHAAETFVLLRDGMRSAKVAALARSVLFRRVRTLLIRGHAEGLIATTLNFDYEVRSAKEAFEDLPGRTRKGEMLELAEHIIETKKGVFEPTQYTDRYEDALAALVKAKLAGKKIEVRPQQKPGKVIDLMAALRASAGGGKISPANRTSKAAKPKEKPNATRRRKAS